MSRDPAHREPDPDPDERREPAGSLRPTPPLTLVGWAAVGLVCGWALHPVSDRLGVVPPLVTLAQPLALLLLAGILGYVAWVTHRAVHVRRERLEAHQAVNRLVLARASALVAALVAGGYAGYALSWVGDAADQADDRIIGASAACVCALLAVLAAVLLERACRVHDDPDT
ncbi:uncharacterized protein DUF3180 [Nocardioides sp. J9]|uniref:DUF3180 domain-containing protein n=1 Tax=Nocardioides sp. J9 TaxID=935844 RepID=UPI0011AC6FF4|nr:DUF3180 domain-containing protein [Nocardioides sp. J9]TWG90627.1 uncharacterized protein DUF3180 [Nocardioides sp. J9]